MQSGLCQCHAALCVHAVKPVKSRRRLLGLALHAHADPHVGEQHVGVPGGLVGVGDVSRKLIAVLSAPA